MALSHSPSIVRSGLVFYYDMNNTKKSWKGAPVTNLYGSIDNSNIRTPNTVHFWDGNSWSTTGSYTHPGVAGPVGTYLGKVYKFTSGALSSTWSGNSYGYMLKTMATTNAQYNAMSCWAFVSDNCNIDGMPATIESASSTSAIAGIPSSYDLIAKGTWQRIGLSCTASAGNMNFIPMYPRKEGVTDGSFTGFFMFAMPQVETNTYPSVGTETSRSSTQAILDLTNNRTITANALSYNIDNTFSYDGTGYADIGTNSYGLGIRRSATFSGWVNATSFTNSVYVMSDYSVAALGMSLRINAGGASSDFYVYPNNHRITATYAFALNTWYFLTGVMDNANIYLYINGTLVGTTTLGEDIGSADNLKIGCRGSTGAAAAGPCYVSQAMIYNRALSASEVLQNFNAQRDRYGI